LRPGAAAVPAIYRVAEKSCALVILSADAFDRSKESAFGLRRSGEERFVASPRPVQSRVSLEMKVSEPLSSNLL